ncbi:FtsX-like permease family protein, partial [Silvibacterium sp.]|uniref:FtsX-like permease family protein n=1 Tax=Silvibacterium sp. TaxID=1964179 RepID=UPI0039E32439
GGGCGVWLAEGLLSLLYRLRDSSLADFPRPSLSFPVLAFTALLALLAGVAAGLAPAWLVRRQDPGEVLKSGGWWKSGGFAHRQLHRVLVSSEVTLALILVAGAGLLIRSMQKVQAEPLGYGVQHLLTFSVNLHGKPYDDEKAGPQTIVSYQDRMLSALRALPGVERAAAVDGVPLRNGPEMVLMVRAGAGAGSVAGAQDAGMPRLSTPGYLHTMGIQLVAGRDFADTDNAAAPQVIIVTDDLANKLWPGINPLGQTLQCDWYCGDGATVVGIAARQKSWGAREDAIPLYYVPYRQKPMARMTFVLRTTVDPASLMRAVSSVAANVDPAQPVFAVETMKMLAEDKEGLARLELLSLSVFGALSFVLAAVGIYGTVSYGVERRTREIGLRMALGADRSRVLRAVLREGVVLVLAGAVPGLTGALLLGRLLKAAVFGVPVHDPVTLAATTLLFLLVGTIGAMLPARRAAQVEPMDALRQE